MAIALEEGSGIPVQKQDLSKIDFGKLTLPEWRGSVASADYSHDGIYVSTKTRSQCGPLLEEWTAFAGRGKSVDEWTLLCMATETEIALFKDICSKVDAFIATELARLVEPDWVEVKWTEVERLISAGCTIGQSCDKSYGYKVRNGTGAAIKHWCYAVDRKTLPDGVALYEPDWVDVSWTDADKLREAGATVEFQHDNGLWDISLDARFATNIPCHADRKTFPTGWEERKAATIQKPSIRSRLDELLINRHGVRVATPSEMVCALVDVLDAER